MQFRHAESQKLPGWCPVLSVDTIQFDPLNKHLPRARYGRSAGQALREAALHCSTTSRPTLPPAPPALPPPPSPASRSALWSLAHPQSLQVFSTALATHTPLCQTGVSEGGQAGEAGCSVPTLLVAVMQCPRKGHPS